MHVGTLISGLEFGMDPPLQVPLSSLKPDRHGKSVMSQNTCRLDPLEDRSQ